MNKREYLSALEAQLKRLPSDDVKEIVKEFDAHFDIASSEGKTEEETAAKLGSPEEVAKYYLGDSVPDFDVASAGAAVPPPFPIIPVKTGMVIDRGIGPQTAAGFANGRYAKPVVNTPPKAEPANVPFAHTGAKEKETYSEPIRQGKKEYTLPDYSQYPSKGGKHPEPAAKEHNLAFAILFTIFVFVPLWILALGILVLLIGLPVVQGLMSGVLFSWVPGMCSGVAGTVCMAISLAFAAIAFVFVAFFAIKGFILGTVDYFRYIFKINSGSKEGGNA